MQIIQCSCGIIVHESCAFIPTYVDDLNLVRTFKEPIKIVIYLKNEFEKKDLKRTKCYLVNSLSHVTCVILFNNQHIQRESKALS